MCFFTCHKKCAEEAPHTCIDKTEADLVPEPEPEVKWLNIEGKNSDLSTYYKKGDPYEIYKKKDKLGEGGGGIVYEVRLCRLAFVWPLTTPPRAALLRSRTRKKRPTGRSRSSPRTATTCTCWSARF